jgi:hypothetical protein
MHLIIEQIKLYFTAASDFSTLDVGVLEREIIQFMGKLGVLGDIIFTPACRMG